MSAPAGRIAIAGHGPIAWIAASALARAFHHRRLQIVVVETAAADPSRVRWMLPSQRGMHAMLGLPEVPFMRLTGASFRLATEHVGWQGGQSSFLHAHGDIGTELGGAPFYKLLVKRALAGDVQSPEAFSIAARAARLGRFARPMGEEQSLTASFTYGYQVADAPYVELLREHARRLGVRRVDGPLGEVSLAPDGSIASLSTPSETIDADLFIDCTGPEALLRSKLSRNERDDWSAWLPCDRVLSALAPPTPETPATTRTIARDHGWLWQAPLAQSSGAGYVYSSRHLSDDAALAELRSIAPAIHASRLAKLAAGRRRRAWERNCVALGSAAVELEPLAGADLHLAQLGLVTLIELFPMDAASTVEADEYNRLMGEHADALRDFTIAHYRAGAARAGAFWDETRAAPLPDTLAHKLDLFAVNGRIQLLDQESFEETDWAWLLLGAGCRPVALDWQIDARLAQVKPEQMAALRGDIERLVSTMPPHMDYLRGYVFRQASHAR